MQNIRAAAKKNAMVTAVVKADAYGHGALEVSRTALKNGADRLAVACVSEAKQLRRNGITAPIMILGACELDEADEIVKYDIIPAVFSYDFARALSEAAAKLEKCAKIHVKLDTGMSRIGYVAGEDDSAAVSEIKRISKLENIEIEGIFSHF